MDDQDLPEYLQADLAVIRNAIDQADDADKVARMIGTGEGYLFGLERAGVLTKGKREHLEAQLWNAQSEKTERKEQFVGIFFLLGGAICLGLSTMFSLDLKLRLLAGVSMALGAILLLLRPVSRSNGKMNDTN
jgi:hypothetical protein